MRVKIFSHEADPDGIGSVILAKLAFQNVSFTLCKGVQELNQEILKFLENENVEKYDKVFITDLCPSNEVMKIIDENEELKAKCFVFDHHVSSKDQLEKNYSFAVVEEVVNGVRECGTSLFYKYLLRENLLEEKTSVATFVELTRLHDTWEWKKDNNLDAYHLQIFFQAFGNYGYLYHFLEKCRAADDFSYTDEEHQEILRQLQKNEIRIEQLVNRLFIKKKMNLLMPQYTDLMSIVGHCLRNWKKQEMILIL